MVHKYKPLINVVFGLAFAVLLALGADATTEAFDPCPECYQCSCMQLCCSAGSPCSCEQWDENDSECNGSGGCSWECPGGSSATYCCADFCDPSPNPTP